ncbi:MAG TPA: uroporphyrinogen-III synthase [Methylomirabilota bacterium]|nr:uroporphyrinogen-III synthase [Methylomirabilota bacterium]
MTAVAAARPLRGRVVVVTRPRAQAQAFAGLLEAAGARVLLVPTIAIEPPASWEPLDRALERLDDYRWAVFTSVNGVEMTRRRLEEKGRGADALRGRRLAAIGPATAEALHVMGLEAEVVPEEYVAEALAERLRALIRPGERVLLARAAEARDVLVTLLEAAGARVDEVPAYRTRPAAEDAGELRVALGEGRVDVVTFTSSSTVRHFAELFPGESLPGLLRGVAVACIGPVTRATALVLGLETRIVPREYTIPALAQAITDHYASGPSRANDAT